MFSYFSRLVFYDLNANFQITSNTSDGVEDSNPLNLPSKDDFKDMHDGSPVPPFTQQDIDLYLERYVKCRYVCTCHKMIHDLLLFYF